jgi:hypothetical protein
LDPNARQVGGVHYKTKYEHWDFAVDVRLPYLEATATKYVVRWRKKNGVQDLQKADHYVEKIIERAEKGHVNTVDRELLTIYYSKFVNENIHNPIDRYLFADICCWSEITDLTRARVMIERLVGTVPREDSNRHA